jgi:hypothetical protein
MAHATHIGVINWNFVMLFLLDSRNPDLVANAQLSVIAKRIDAHSEVLRNHCSLQDVRTMEFSLRAHYPRIVRRMTCVSLLPLAILA